MLDMRGFVAETNATHIFLVRNGEVADTTHVVACPEGITRATVLEICASSVIATEVGDFSLTEVYNADEVFVTGTMGGVTPVLSVDGRTIGAGRPGPYVAKLAAAYAERTAAEGTVVV